ncbi:SDR family NAD(P)-dependent oxidoreductase [Streptomyces sp. NPDC057910]|uniref:SDR family NAD(P)-dependent oxidoreductase n=1 Tax=Streptomyces sp. NPDC057910 TaxID=3346278 RepID=UPI0036E874AB
MANSPRTALITGASSGSGLAAAIATARAGWQTIAALADSDQAGVIREAAQKAGVEIAVRFMDVTDEDSVSAAVEGVIVDYRQLNAVVNNVSAGRLIPLQVRSLVEVRRFMEVNYFGVLNVSKAVVPHLRACGGRLITVTNVDGVAGQALNEVSGEADVAGGEAEEGRVATPAPHSLVVSVIAPGRDATECFDNVGVEPGNVGAVTAAAGPYSAAIRGCLGPTAGRPGGPRGCEVAEMIVEALAIKTPAFRIQTTNEGHWVTGAAQGQGRSKMLSGG